MSGKHHHHHHHHQHDHGGETSNILIAFVLNFSFAIIEFIGGYLTNSVAIYSDAVHDLGDSLSLLFSYFAEKMGHKKADKHYTFGYKRFSVLSALLNGVILLGGSFYVIYEASSRIIDPQVVEPKGMVFLAIFGILVNSFAAFKLSKNTGLNSKMVMLHLLEDILGWVAVLIVSITLLFKPWYILDSILSILISIIILKGVYGNLKKVVLILLQKFPDELELSEIKETILKIDSVQSVHAIKGWSIDDETFYLRCHICVPGTLVMNEVDKIKHKVKDVLHQHCIEYSTIEFEAEMLVGCE